MLDCKTLWILLTVLAADMDLNTTNIGLVGLAQTGIEYSL